MAKALTFNKTGYDPFIDFLKAYSIICVILSHLLPFDPRYILFEVWGDMQVPFFVLIQVFHAYKKGSRPFLNWGTIFKRIIIPFLLVQGLIVGIKILLHIEISYNVLKIMQIGGGKDQEHIIFGYTFR